MSGPTEFTLESVRQYMLAQDGQVTNHDLVKYFRAWLAHPNPAEKDASRRKFKEYVHTLATIKQENGVKFLVLKEKFYPRFDDDDDVPPPIHNRNNDGPSLLDEVMAGYNSISSNIRRQMPPPPTQQNSYSHLPPPQPSRILPNPHHHQQQTYAQPPPPPSHGHHSSNHRPQDLNYRNNSSPQQHSNYYSPTHSQRSSYASHQRGSYSSGSPSEMVRMPPPYRPPPPQVGQGHSVYKPVPPPPGPSDLGLPILPQNPPPVNYANRSNIHPQQNFYQRSISGSSISSGGAPIMEMASSYSSSSLLNDPPPLPRRNGGDLPPPPPSSRLSTSSMQSQASSHRTPPPVPPPVKSYFDDPPPLPSRQVINNHNSNANLDVPSHHEPSRPSTPPVVVEKISRESSSEPEFDNKENSTPPLNKEDSSTDIHQQKTDEKISVRERTKTFNRMASEVDVAGIANTGSAQLRKASTTSTSSSISTSAAALKRRNSRATSRSRNLDDKSDSSSINTIDQISKTWMVKSSQGDYHTMMKMLMEDPKLAKVRDFTSGFTALHWAAKHGDLDMVKMLAGNYNVDVNVKSHGGYTPLHLACQFGRQEVFDLLVKAYGADPRIRDNHGKTPRQYMIKQVQSSGLSLSSDTFRQLKDRRRNRRQVSEKNSGILRFGSLSVKVKKTTEAFNNYFGSERKSSWGNDTTAVGGYMDTQKMPPPKFAPIKKRKSKRTGDFAKIKSAPTTPTEKSPVKEEVELSDAEYGFDSNQWG